MIKEIPIQDNLDNRNNDQNIIDHNLPEFKIKKILVNVINEFKKKLDTKIAEYNNTFRQFQKHEFYFNQNFENLAELNEIMLYLDHESDQKLKLLRNISNEEDNIIKQLDEIDKTLDTVIPNKISSQQYEAPIKDKEIKEIEVSISKCITNINSEMLAIENLKSNIVNKVNQSEDQIDDIVCILSNYYEQYQGLKILYVFLYLLQHHIQDEMTKLDK